MDFKQAIKKIKEFEEASLDKIWLKSTIDDKEWGYIVIDDIVHKIVGKSKSVRIPERFMMYKGVIFYHTHPHYPVAYLSSGDVGYLLYRVAENDWDGMGVIAGCETRYWRIRKDIAAQLYAERMELLRLWRMAYENNIASLTRHYRSKVAANTRKARKYLIEYLVETY